MVENDAAGTGVCNFLLLWLITPQVQPHRRDITHTNKQSLSASSVRLHGFAGSQLREEKVAKHKITIKCSKVLFCWQIRNVMGTQRKG